MVQYTYKIIVSYDGTNYYGWQEQDGLPTVAGILQKQYARIFGHQITLVGASRTDGGVHALGQVARFYSPLDISSERFCAAWNAHLPRDMHIRSFERVQDGFHPQRNVDYKIYQYHISVRRPLPFLSRYVTWFPRGFNETKLQEALQHFVGTHDFRSFCTGNEYDNTVRTVDSIACDYIKQYGIYRITVRGPGFMRYMIRRMVGAALAVASRTELEPQDIVTTLERKNPAHQLPTAPSHGLVLRKIIYKG